MLDAQREEVEAGGGDGSAYTRWSARRLDAVMPS
ncbi:hypothetical protein STVIR_5559 [Streptomyces viridochromogenes Tue57]|uniref:Uncharacterized protein n=1 Tax=Streptomyces viridochromogenes Tue57 TaxID=1160705 RepID=L8P7A8_STRVR|nr:hypothetical protein STVIR_5559 [Streptomyces viridochromogenes Tue57]